MQRELTKASTSFLNGNTDNRKQDRTLKGTTLDDLGNEDDGDTYDQFKNKNTTYSENLYTS